MNLGYVISITSASPKSRVNHLGASTIAAVKNFRSSHFKMALVIMALMTIATDKRILMISLNASSFREEVDDEKIIRNTFDAFIPFS